MPEQLRSNLIFTSNLQLRHGPIRTDRQFLANVWDFHTLRLLKEKQLPMTTEQEKIYQIASIPCAFAPAGDFPYGTKRQLDGSVRVACECTNTSCREFRRCRPGVNPETVEQAAPLVIIRCHGTAPKVTQAMSDLPQVKTIATHLFTDNADEQYAAFLSRVDGPDSLALEILYAQVLWPEDLALLERLAAEDPLLPERVLASDDTGLNSHIIWDLSGTESEVEKSLRAAKVMTKARFMELLSAGRQPGERSDFRVSSQDAVIRLGADQRAVINAGPGTGKTWSLIERLIWLVENGDVSPEDIQVLCYSRAAKQVIVDRLRKAVIAGRLGQAWQQLDIRTFDSYSTQLLLFVQAEVPEWLPGIRSRILGSYDERIRKAAQILAAHPQVVAGVRHLIVDEIQDLVGYRADLLLNLAKALPPDCGFTFFGDQCQAIYDYSARSAKQRRSDEMYDQLLLDHEQAQRLSFDDNKRSTGELVSLTLPLRRAILGGRSGRIREAIEKIARQVNSCSIPWQELEGSEFRACTSPDALGILARSNGEALAISTRMRQADIPHTLLLTGQARHYDGWIGRVLLKCQTQTLDEEDFEDLFLQLYPDLDPAICWQAFLETIGPHAMRRFEIRDLLKILADRAENEILLRIPGAPPASITVCTIHKSKGREFDSVILPSGRISKVLKQKSDYELLEESRVLYVAATRARSQLMLMDLPRGAASLKKLRSKTERDGADRWYYSYRQKLRNIEVGAADDLDPVSFGASETLQQYFMDRADSLSGIELELRLESEEHEPGYGLYDRDHPSFRLAKASPYFMEELKQTLAPSRRTSSVRSVRTKLPDLLRDIYVQRVVTFVGSAATAPPGARLFGDQAVWLGLEVIGLAKSADYDY